MQHVAASFIETMNLITGERQSGLREGGKKKKNPQESLSTKRRPGRRKSTNLARTTTGSQHTDSKRLLFRSNQVAHRDAAIVTSSFLPTVFRLLELDSQKKLTEEQWQTRELLGSKSASVARTTPQKAKRWSAGSRGHEQKMQLPAPDRPQRINLSRVSTLRFRTSETKILTYKEILIAHSSLCFERQNLAKRSTWISPRKVMIVTISIWWCPFCLKVGLRRGYPTGSV